MVGVLTLSMCDSPSTSSTHAVVESPNNNVEAASPDTSPQYPALFLGTLRLMPTKYCTRRLHRVSRVLVVRSSKKVDSCLKTSAIGVASQEEVLESKSAMTSCTVMIEWAGIVFVVGPPSILFASLLLGTQTCMACSRCRSLAPLKMRRAREGLLRSLLDQRVGLLDNLA
jgi:hypothetical protein